MDKWPSATGAQWGCQPQSAVSQHDSERAATGGESCEICVSCLPCQQTTPLCFTGPFPPSSTLNDRPPTFKSTSARQPKKKVEKVPDAAWTNREHERGGEKRKTEKCREADRKWNESERQVCKEKKKT